jgi:hypothetical protein
MRRLLVTANVSYSSPILVTLMKEGLSSSETSILTRATEDTILHSHHRENLKSYNQMRNPFINVLAVLLTFGVSLSTHLRIMRQLLWRTCTAGLYH